VSKSGFEDALLPFYEPLQRRLLMIVRDREMAVDLTQDAYAKAWRAWDKFDGREPRAWIFQIGTRLALNHLRGTRRWLHRFEFREEKAAFLPEVDDDLWDAMQELRPVERSALLLHAIDGYTYEEIALLLGTKVGTVGSLVSRARKRLQTRLGASHD
jgi:RNA polymerase sigma-70 factor (ECF subfamily)